VKLLISPQNPKEAAQAIAGGADIIDVKNPREGPLGASFPWVIEEIKQLLPVGIELSCTLGEAPNLPGSMALAAYGGASLGVDYVKAGLSGVKTLQEAVALLEGIVKAAKQCNPKVKVVVAGYADYQRAQSIEPLLVVKAAAKANADLAMLDTAVKDGKNLFDFQSTSQIKEFVDIAHRHKLGVALAGSLRAQDLSVVLASGADFAGLRGAACSNSNRETGHITCERVRELVEIIRQASKERA
jgi:uncharacterized protein (UPF0264 family)